MVGKALLVIDMQNVCVGENHASAFKYDNTALIRSVNKVISQYEDENVYYILNIMKDNFLSKLTPIKAFDGSSEVALADGLSIVSNKWFKKYSGNAFTNPELKPALLGSGVDEIEIIGVDGGGCVAQTALGAIKEGFKVTVNTGAVGTMLTARAQRLNKKLKSQGAVFI